jgi:hypothetical protein
MESWSVKSVNFLEVMSSEYFYKNDYTDMRRITTFRSTTDLIYDGGPIRLYYNTYHCVTIAYSIQYSNMLYRFVAQEQ